MTANFDRVAGLYRWLERLAFGRDLERTRTALMDRLDGAGRILVLGEGDGRFLAAFLRRNPAARVTCVDASAAMLARARARLSADAAARVTFRCADARAERWPDAAFDAVVTLFFLDCFSRDETAELVSRLAAALTPDAVWLWADFHIPSRGWPRLRARLWVGGLYRFFGLTTGLTPRHLPPAEALIAAAGFRAAARAAFQRDLLRTVAFTRGGRGSG